jgi:peptidoglycan-associated lipoprotein
MNHRQWQVHALLVPTFALGAVLAGCAKQPNSVSTSAPAPTGSGSSTTSKPGKTAVHVKHDEPGRPGETGAGLEAGTGPGSSADSMLLASTARPVPSEFNALATLKDIYFDFDRYDILPAAAKVLDESATWLKDNARYLVLIEGHADERGTNDYNLALGERRAKSAMNYLASRGVQAGRITIVSYGEERPLCTDHNDGCWAKNRRARLLVKAQ